jgi:hypothetical protein
MIIRVGKTNYKNGVADRLPFFSCFTEAHQFQVTEALSPVFAIPGGGLPPGSSYSPPYQSLVFFHLYVLSLRHLAQR